LIFKVIAYDAVNHGNSSHHPDMSYPDLADDLVTLMDKFELEQSLLIGRFHYFLKINKYKKQNSKYYTGFPEKKANVAQKHHVNLCHSTTRYKVLYSNAYTMIVNHCQI